MAEPHRDDRAPVELSARDARQGTIVLRHRWERLTFIAGMAALVIVAFIVGGWVAGS